MTTLRSTSATTVREPVQVATATVGAAFLLIGLLGLVPGTTAELFGLFDAPVLLNLAYLAFGVAAVALARTPMAGAFLLCGGSVCMGLWVYGVVRHDVSAADFVSLSDPDLWLHLGLATGMVALGLVLEPPRRHG